VTIGGAHARAPPDALSRGHGLPPTRGGIVGGRPWGQALPVAARPVHHSTVSVICSDPVQLQGCTKGDSIRRQGPGPCDLGGLRGASEVSLEQFSAVHIGLELPGAVLNCANLQDLAAKLEQQPLPQAGTSEFWEPPVRAPRAARLRCVVHHLDATGPTLTI
jgi:hypothetical protein